MTEHEHHLQQGDHPQPPRNIWKKFWDRFVRIRGNSREIALGMALGIFVGMSPTMGLQTVIAVFVASLLRWNKLSAAMGVWISNPFTAIFLYGTTYSVGHNVLKLFHGVPQQVAAPEFTIFGMIKHAPEKFLELFIGGVIIGLPLAVISFYVSQSAIVKYRQKYKAKIHNKVEKIHDRVDKIRHRRHPHD